MVDRVHHHHPQGGTNGPDTFSHSRRLRTMGQHAGGPRWQLWDRQWIESADRRCAPDPVPLESQGAGGPGSRFCPHGPRSSSGLPYGARDLDLAGRGPRELSGHPTMSVDEASTARQLGPDYSGSRVRRQAGPGLAWAAYP